MVEAVVSERSSELIKDHRQKKSKKDVSSSSDDSSSLDYEELVKKRRQPGAQPVIEVAKAQEKDKEESSSKSSSEASNRVAKEEVKAEIPKAKPAEPAKKGDEDEDWVLSEPPAKPVPEVAKKESPKAASGTSKE